MKVDSANESYNWLKIIDMSKQKTETFSRDAQKTQHRLWQEKDSVEISNFYREYQAGEPMVMPEDLQSLDSLFETTSTVGEFSGSNSVGLRKYMNIGGGYGETSLLTINNNRKKLGERINALIQQSGITLNKNEKISISVGADKQIKVTGVSKDKAKKIAEALNDDEKLATELKRHYANGKINNQAEQQRKAAEYYGDSPKWDDIFTNRSLRAFVIDDYLQGKVGIGLNDITLNEEDGTVALMGAAAGLKDLLGEDPMLGQTIANILQNNEQTLEFGVSFEFSNGALADSATEDAAKAKIKQVQDRVLDKIDAYNEAMTSGGSIQADEMQDRLVKSFSIRVNRDGEFEIVGAENMDSIMVATLKSMVQKALDEYAGGMDGYTGGSAIANFSGVSAAFLESHQYEHGDTEEFPHEVEIAFNGGFVDVKVVSEEADKAREEMTQGVSDELGRELRSVLEEQGVEVGEGIDVEIDENGKIKVVGDLKDPNLKLAQTVLDSFAQQAKTQGFDEVYGGESEYNDIIKERTEIKG